MSDSDVARLIEKRTLGTDRFHWDVYFPQESGFPECGRKLFERFSGKKRGYKSPFESPEDYIERMGKGRILKREDRIYAVKGDVALDFSFQYMCTEDGQETINPILPSCALEFLEPEPIDIPVRNHKLRLEYQGWIPLEQNPGALEGAEPANRPNLIHIIQSEPSPYQRAA